ncbi:hypothetical protein TNCV_1559361 [Trichonephila clavipes]|nr:hypothetical protein TNCV_1559361 [Trichonephila clavipes]
MVLKAKANDRRKILALSRDEFRGPRLGFVRQESKIMIITCIDKCANSLGKPWETLATGDDIPMHLGVYPNWLGLAADGDLQLQCTGLFIKWSRIQARR